MLNEPTKIVEPTFSIIDSIMQCAGQLREVKKFLDRSKYLHKRRKLETSII